MAKRRRRSSASKKTLIYILLAAAVVTIVLYLTRCSGNTQIQSSVSGIMVSEVMSSNKGAVADETGDFPDWVEIYNNTDTAENIGGYGLSDDLTAGAKWTFPQGTVIQPGGYLLVFCSGDTTRGSMHTPFKISVSDEIILTTVSGTVIDSVKLKAVASGSTLSRDPANPGQWIETRPSPGYPNTEEGANAYIATITADSGEDIGVYINEFMASNASTLVGPDGSYCDWMELYNTTGSDVDLSGYGVSDDTAQPLKYTLPQGTRIPAMGVLLIYCTGRETSDPSSIEAPFALASYQEAVVFSNPKGKILDSYEYTRQSTDISMARVPDGTGAFTTSAQPTPGYTNNSAGARAFMATLSYGSGEVVLTEAMNANYSYLKQADQNYYDWVEVHNSSSSPVSLSGYALSDNAKNPAKWLFPDISLDAGEYLVVYCSGKNISDGQKKNELHTNFGLSGDGDIVLLFDPQGNIADKLLLTAGHADVSYGRTNGQLMYYKVPTPGMANSGGLSGYTDEPVFTLASGAYGSAQQVEIRAVEGASVTYTTDGSEPTQKSAPYTGPISLNGTTVLRARAFSSGLYGSDTATATYMIHAGSDTLKDHKISGLAVMSITTDPVNLWDLDTGIYVLGRRYAEKTGQDGNGWTMEKLMNAEGATLSNFWQQWEKPAHFDLIAEDGSLEYSDDCVIRIFGAYSRAKEQKAIAIIGRSGYGPSVFQHSFFPNRPYTWYKSLVMRPSAQDNTYSKMRDIVVTSLLEDGGDYGLPPESQIAVQAYRQMVMLLNGQYWGVYNLREKISSNFITQHYGLSNPDAVEILVGNGNEKCVVAGTDCWRDYTDMVEWAGSHDLSDPANYNYICSLMDVDNFALYTAAEIIVGNTDTGNIKYWRTQETDNKWRWLFYDFCWAMNRDDENSDAYTSGFRRDFFSRYFHEEGHGASKATSTVLIRALLKNETFRAKFLNFCAYLFNNVYTTEKIIARVDECQERIRAEMAWDVDLWDGINQKSWEQHCEHIRNYARNYPEYYLKYVQNYFNLSDSQMVTLFGRVTTLSTVSPESEG